MISDPPDIEALVRQVVQRTLGSGRPGVRRAGEQGTSAILGEHDVRLMPANTTQEVTPGTLITPLARQAALERQIVLLENPVATPHSAAAGNFAAASVEQQIVALGADHGGYEMKERLKETVSSVGYQILDCGTHGRESVDYPDYAYAVARAVSSGRACRGILIDGAGIGSCMAANKVPGVRAAMCYDQATAVNSREHNNANVLTLGAGLIGPSLAQQIVVTFLSTDFAGGRHARRVDKIDAIGERYSKY